MADQRDPVKDTASILRVISVLVKKPVPGCHLLFPAPRPGIFGRSMPSSDSSSKRVLSSAQQVLESTCPVPLSQPRGKRGEHGRRGTACAPRSCTLKQFTSKQDVKSAEKAGWRKPRGGPSFEMERQKQVPSVLAEQPPDLGL